MLAIISLFAVCLAEKCGKGFCADKIFVENQEIDTDSSKTLVNA